MRKNAPDETPEELNGEHPSAELLVAMREADAIANDSNVPSYTTAKEALKAAGVM